MQTITEHAAAVWFESERPARLVWNRRRWHVIDTPTRLGNDGWSVYAAVVTHPPEPWSGWRFIARAEDGDESLLFDVKETACGEWMVVRAEA